MKIGFLDSGFGGLSVWLEFRKRIFDTKVVYFGDLANSPYGEKSSKEVSSLTKNASEFLIKEKKVEALLLACNTATAVAVKEIQQEYKIPVFGMEPAIKPAAKDHPSQKIAVLATAVTHRESKIQTLIEGLGVQDRILSVSCDGLATLIDQGNIREAMDYLNPILNSLSKEGVDAIVLGCTHYVFLKPFIKKEFPSFKVFDGNTGTVTHMQATLNLPISGNESELELFFNDGRESSHSAAMKLIKDPMEATL